MKTTSVPHTNVQVSRIGLGCNNFGWHIDADRARAVVDAAIEHGITFLDTADVYGMGGEGPGASERHLGEILKGRRDRVVIATKWGYPSESVPKDAGSPAYIREAIERSLERLQTDWIDVYYYHRPDGVTPLEETLGALDELVSEGKVRAVGASGFNTELLEQGEAAASSGGTVGFRFLQERYNMLDRANGAFLPFCREYGVGFVPWFPLASGLLTGKWTRGQAAPQDSRLANAAEPDEATFEKLERLGSWAQDHGHTLPELALAWLASQEGVASVIAGATSPSQVEANARAASWELTPSELEEVSAL
jgi:aryl-alcohol dehydrogenase-like predicted oxidoreductase